MSEVKGLARRVIIIGLDGAGNMVKDTETPNIDRLLAGGFVSYEARTVLPTISGECWGSMFHGVQPKLHGLTNEVADTQKYPLDSPYPSFMKLLRDAEPEPVIASLSAWQPINDGIIEEGAANYVANVHADRHHVQKVGELLETHPDFRLLFIQFDGIDGAGHAFGYGTPAYLDIIRETDGYIGDISSMLEQRGLLDGSLIIMLADHGGGGADPNGHGSAHPQDVTIFWGCSGPGVSSAIAAEDICITDTAAVAAYALGLEAPELWSGRVPQGLFRTEPEQDGFGDLPEYYHAPLREAIDKVRQAQDEETATLIYYTDAHHKTGGNQLRVAQAIRHLAREIAPDCIVAGGDWSENGDKADVLRSQRELMSALRVDGCPVLPVKGNHDDNSIHDFHRKWKGANHVIFPIEAYNDFYSKLEGTVSFDKGNETGLYFYYDLPEKKTRVVVLNSIDIVYQVNRDGMLEQNGQWEYAFSDRQLHWVKEHVFDFSGLENEDEWKTVIFSHVPILQRELTGYTDGEVANGEKLWKVLRENRSRISACLFGHVHIDQVYAIDEIPLITTLNSVSYKNFPESPDKIRDTISEAVVDIVTINYAKGELLLTRLGAGEDRQISITSTNG
ncbi:alkaline phosphatase family protein [Paenibacillus sp. J5C_2022]|nr:alkaline phosphatase family protein [Paenibacillus sp. J5C2022]